jgi:hypothetical protein
MTMPADPSSGGHRPPMREGLRVALTLWPSSSPQTFPVATDPNGSVIDNLTMPAESRGSQRASSSLAPG